MLLGRLILIRELRKPHHGARRAEVEWSGREARKGIALVTINWKSDEKAQRPHPTLRQSSVTFRKTCPKIARATSMNVRSSEPRMPNSAVVVWAAIGRA